MSVPAPARPLLAALLALLLAGCAAWFPQAQQRQNASMVDYLFPKEQNVQMRPEASATLRLPLRVGIAFVPGGAVAGGLPEAERLRMLGKVKEAFAGQPFISAIEIIPTAYLQPRGGFANMEQAARMFNVDVVALLSYDQVQFNDANALSLLYWTIIGAYVVHGDQYDIHTMLDASVFDVGSRKLLFRAPGVSEVKGSAAMASFTERARQARMEGYNQALDKLVPELHGQLAAFRERVKSGADGSVKVVHSPGYSGGGALGWLGTALALLLLAAGAARGRQR